MDVTEDSMVLIVLKDVQTGRMDTTVTIPVAIIARCLGCVTGKQDIVTVKSVGNQKSVTHHVMVIRMGSIVQRSVVRVLTLNNVSTLMGHV